MFGIEHTPFPGGSCAGGCGAEQTGGAACRLMAAVTPNPARNPSRPSVQLAALLPPGIAAAELSGPADPRLLLPAEREALGPVAQRRAHEFTAGRLCARRATALLGVADCAIGTRLDRRPRWPAPLVGSITHTAGFAAAAVGDRGRFRAIGIDAELSGAVHRDLWGYVLSPEERRDLARLPAQQQARVATLVFSAKEAFFKCQYEVTQHGLEPGEVSVDFPRHPLDGDRCTVRPAGAGRGFELGGGPAVVRYAATGAIVLAAMVIPEH